MTRLKFTMIKLKISRRKAHQRLVKYRRYLKEWRKWKYSRDLEQLYVNELCKIIGNALHKGGIKNE